jgi:hypothetical protein
MPNPAIKTIQAKQPSHSVQPFPTHRISIKRGLYEYACTFLVTLVILGTLMIAGPTGVETFIIKLFQGKSTMEQSTAVLNDVLHRS